MNLELRTILEPLEIRSQKGGKIVVEGVAVKYGSPSKNEIGPGIVEEIRSGAFTKTLSESDQLMLHEHKPELYLARRSNGTLRFADSPVQLDYEFEMPDTSVGRDVANLIESRAVKGSSVGMYRQYTKATWSKLDSGLVLRSVRESRMQHVATTCIPIYEDTTADLVLRSLAEATGHTIDEAKEAADAGETASLLDTPIEVPDLSALSVDQLREELAQREHSEETEPAETTPIHRRPQHWFV